MRFASILILTAVAAAGAAAAEDRYGPEPAGQSADMAQSGSGATAPYHGAFLSWAGKAPARTLDEPPPYARPVAPVAYAPPAAEMASRYERPEAPAADAYVPIARAYPSPQAPASPPARRSRPSPPPEPASPPPPPERSETARAAPSSPMVVATGPAAGGPAAPVRARYYSLHREYGDTPDRISMPQSRPPVLIGPGEGSGSNSIGDDASPSKAPKHSADDSPAF
ncbi:MAG TPA: hypothetical protein VFC47_04275 [Caulobacteraceae bacterium]|nr:hypothetical protein [Caulobacteraceae bacterium]